MGPVIDHPSPNHDARADGTPVDMLVLHYTGMRTGEAALARMCDPAAKVSAHYMIEEDGRIFRLVPEVISVLDYAKGFGHTDLAMLTPEKGPRRWRRHPNRVAAGIAHLGQRRMAWAWLLTGRKDG